MANCQKKKRKERLIICLSRISSKLIVDIVTFVAVVVGDTFFLVWEDTGGDDGGPIST